MKYDSGSAFRRALEDRLRMRSLQTGAPLVRLRKLVAFDRFLARLFNNQPGQWVLKGGFALQIRLGEKARTTKDIDVLALDSSRDLTNTLRQAASLDLDDWFSFEVELPEREGETGSQRYPLLAFLDSRPFEKFHVDVGVGDPMIEEPDLLATPNILSFAEIGPTIVPCYPLTQQIAEKLHAYTRLHLFGENSRVKDFVDMLLIAKLGEIDATKLIQAIHATFVERGTHELPDALIKPPILWERTFVKMASEVGLSYATLEEAFEALKKFLDPVFSEKSNKTWDPFASEWY
jgi:hypothetical protein